MLEILYQDDYLIAINKPSGLLVHKSKYAGPADEYAVEKLTNQIGKKVHLVHRLDRKTSGVLLFAFDKETLKLISDQFMNREVEKKYLAILRGWTKEEETIDYDLTNENEIVQNAITYYRRLQISEIDLPFQKHPTSRYSFVEAIPETGRFPDGWVHKNGRINPNDIFVQLNHRFPPILFDVIFQFCAVLSVIVDCRKSVIDFAGRKNKTIFFSVGNHFFENIFLLCHN
jgi:hypothetical protein